VKKCQNRVPGRIRIGARKIGTKHRRYEDARFGHKPTKAEL